MKPTIARDVKDRGYNEEEEECSVKNVKQTHFSGDVAELILAEVGWGWLILEIQLNITFGVFSLLESLESL